MKHYFLFGNDAVRYLYFGGTIEGVKKELDGNYDIFCFTDGDSPIYLLDAVIGWGDYIEISEDEYNILNS